MTFLTTRLGTLPPPQIQRRVAIPARGRPIDPEAFARQHRSGIVEMTYFRLTHQLWVRFQYGGWYYQAGLNESWFDLFITPPNPTKHFSVAVLSKSHTLGDFEPGVPPIARPDRHWAK